MKLFLVCVVCAFVLATAAPALATSPTQGAYQGPGYNQLIQVTGNSAADGRLPFTGLSLPVLMAVAIALTGTGVALRIKSRPANR